MDFLKLFDSFISITAPYLEYLTNLIWIFGPIWGWKEWKCKKIRSDLDARKNLDNLLGNYVLEKYRNNVKDITIISIYYKHYPYDLNYDGHEFCIKVSYSGPDILFNSWRDNTGIKICEHIWFIGCSVYVNSKNGVAFVSYSGKSYKNFQEYKNCCLVYYLLYRNIINYDFECQLEHAPRFYVRYKKSYKNFDNEVQIIPRNFETDDYHIIRIDNRLIMEKYNLFIYMYYLVKSKILKIPLLRMKIHI